jgi:hemerythrin-like domain-containing protein
MEEHRVIERVLASLTLLCDQLEEDGELRLAVFLDAADIMKGFADICHHCKEEGVLFPAMERSGVARQGGPIGVMLAEHEEARRLTGAMGEAAEKLAAGDASAKFGVLQNARDYVALLEQHILKEDSILFPMADEVLGEEKRRDLDEAFAIAEREEISEGVCKKYLGKVEALEREAKG